MKAYDQGSSIFWLLLSISVFVESLRLGVGTLHNPGTGFMSFGASALLGILSIIVFLHASLKNERTKAAGPLFAGLSWKRVLPVMISLPIYSRLLPVAGYLITTFLLMTFLFWILERRKVWLVFVLSLITTFSTYYIFSVLLSCQFPSGPFGF